MIFNIYKLESDSAGNQCWVLVDNTKPDVTTALAHATSLSSDGNTYAVETSDGQNSQRISQV
jgi:hypothetical protein